MSQSGGIFASLLLLAAAPLTRTPTEANLRAADAEQMRIIVEEDAKAQQEFMHPNYIINAPANRVLRKHQVVSMLAHGGMASDRFERVIVSSPPVKPSRQVITPTWSWTSCQRRLRPRYPKAWSGESSMAQNTWSAGAPSSRC